MITYKCYKKVYKEDNKGGDYWRDVDFNDHLKLTQFQTTFQYLIKNYPAPQNVLEAGCGLGRWVIPLSEGNYKVTGLEIEKEALDIINKNYKSDNLTLIHGDVFNMLFSDKTFDIILSLGVLEHYENSINQRKAIMEHIRVLKDDGIFIVTVPYASWIRFIMDIPFIHLVSLVRLFKKKKQFFTEYRYTQRTFTKILKSCELEIINVVYDELLEPYNFGLTVDYPIKRLFKSKSLPYTTNKIGRKVFKLLWKIHPKIVSGGIAFICKKKYTR